MSQAKLLLPPLSPSVRRGPWRSRVSPGFALRIKPGSVYLENPLSLTKDSQTLLPKTVDKKLKQKYI
jgi:hypothetical protein